MFHLLISFHSEGCLFTLICCAKAFKFNQVPLVYFCFYFHYFRRWVTEDIALIYDIGVLPMFSSKSFTVSGLTFRSLIHFELIFVYGVRKCSNFILLHVAVQFFQHHCFEEAVFAPLYILASFVKNTVPIVAWIYFWDLYLVPLV